MPVNDQPGCSGAAASVFNKPGIQKLTPPSSATAGLVPHVNAQKKTSPTDVRRISDIERPQSLISLERIAVEANTTCAIFKSDMQQIDVVRLTRKFISMSYAQRRAGNQ